jgi:hypothetical protein
VKYRTVVRRSLLGCVLVLLLLFTWEALAGGFRQLPRARTLGQKIETFTQIECGLLTLLVVVTCFWQRRWSRPVRAIWGISLAAAAGLSALVWGPPMPLLGLLYAALSLLVALAVDWTLRLGLTA